MTQIIYDIVSRNGGWCISCGGLVGPPYNRKSEAIGDALFISQALKNWGEKAIVLVEGKVRPSTVPA